MFETKDALARLMRLTQSTGSISEYVVVAPFFPSLDMDFFKIQHNLKQDVSGLGMKFIGFGTKHPKNTYTYNDIEYTNESFEKGLDRLFKPYYI